MSGPARQRTSHSTGASIRDAGPCVPSLNIPEVQLGVFLTSHFAEDHLYALMRRPWRYGEQQCPRQPLLHTMLGCLQNGRPDLIERPCMLIATGE